MNGYAGGGDDMSALLLAGWTMLAEVCPSCNYPLMRSREGETICTNHCGREAREAQEEEKEEEREPRVNGEIFVSQSQQQQRQQQQSPPTSVRRRGSAEDGRTETATEALGRLLLRGYTMLSESCAHCKVPLMRAPAASESLCVSCNRKFDPRGVALALAPPTTASPRGSAPERRITSLELTAGLPSTSLDAVGSAVVLENCQAVWQSSAETVLSKLQETSTSLRQATDPLQIKLWAEALESLASAYRIFSPPK